MLAGFSRRWGYVYRRQGDPFDRTIDVAVSRLRRKLCCSEDGGQLIKTVRGGGYVFAAAIDDDVVGKTVAHEEESQHAR